MAQILVNVMAEEIRMALVDSQGQVVDYVLERQNKSHTANHIYKGVIRNVLPGMNACLWILGPAIMRILIWLNLNRHKSYRNCM